MSNHKTYDIKPEIVSTAHLDEAGYDKMYAFSIQEPDKFWDEQAKQFLDWMEPWEKVREFNYATASIRWFEGAKLNVSQNCLDRHLATRGDQTAIIWEGDEPGDDRTISYRELYSLVCRFANALKAKGVKKGEDRRASCRERVSSPV